MAEQSDQAWGKRKFSATGSHLEPLNPDNDIALMNPVDAKAAARKNAEKFYANFLAQGLSEQHARLAVGIIEDAALASIGSAYPMVLAAKNPGASRIRAKTEGRGGR